MGESLSTLRTTKRINNDSDQANDETEISPKA